jgi:hypothetical protein
MKLLVSLFILSLALNASQIFGYESAQSRAMGGASTAVVNNNSAMYSNPAALVNLDGLNYIYTTFEIGSQAKVIQDKNRDTTIYDKDNNNSYFLGVSVITKYFGIGISHYNLSSYNVIDGAYTTKETLSVTPFVGAVKITDKLYPNGGAISFGALYANVLGELNTAGTSDPNIENTTADISGYFYDLGLKMRALELDAYKINLGLNYRSHARLTGKDDNKNPIVGVGIPQEIAFGAAGYYAVDWGLFTLALDLKQTSYKKATEESTAGAIINDAFSENLGLEYANKRFILRAGTFNTAFKKSSDSITGVSGGVAILFNKEVKKFKNLGSFKKIVLEFAYDKKTYTSNSIPTDVSVGTFAIDLGY